MFIGYYIAKEKENLEKLMSAVEPWKKRRKPEPKALGTALGFPKEAVEGFMTKRENVLICGSYTLVCVAEAKKAGIEIPSWLAYIHYVIEELDLINGKVSESSKALGEKYQRYIQKHNPGLARKVERHFRQTFLPISWELKADGWYELDYGDYSFKVGS